jgi:DNA-binding HxlR family transcriptional regulator
MDIEKFSTGTCPVARSLTRAGDAWTFLILRDAGLGLTRFDEFRASLGIAPNILTRRLKALTEGGLLEKRRYSERPPRDEYVLTDAGRDFLPILQAMGAWGRRHNGAGALNRLVNLETGADVEPLVIDRRSGQPLADLNIGLVGPDGGPRL